MWLLRIFDAIYNFISNLIDAIAEYCGFKEKVISHRFTFDNPEKEIQSHRFTFDNPENSYQLDVNNGVNIEKKYNEIYNIECKNRTSGQKDWLDGYFEKAYEFALVKKFDNPQTAFERDVNNGVNIEKKYNEIYNIEYKNRTSGQKDWLHEYARKASSIYVKTTKTNNIDDYKAEFKKYKTSTALANGPLSKPLCIYAVSKKHDHNGAVLSDKALKKIMDEIKNIYEKHYTVIPILFDRKENLDKKLEKYKTISSDISLLVIYGHGNIDSVIDFFTSSFSSAKLLNISSDSQIILDACLTAGGENVQNSIAYKMAKDNPRVEVFGAADSINYAKPNIEYINGQPQVKNVEFWRSAAPVTSWSIQVQNERARVENQQNI